MTTYPANTVKNLLTKPDEFMLVLRNDRIVGRGAPGNCLQGAFDCVVLVGTKDEIDAELQRRGGQQEQADPLESQVRRALAQRDQIDAFLARPEVATVVQQVQAGKLQPAGGIQAEHG